MSLRRLASADVQPTDFAFNSENQAWVRAQIAKYPPNRQASAVIPLLMRAQEQEGGWVSEPAIDVIADMLGMARIRVLEIATFYTQFNLAPVGRYCIQLCGTTPCMLRGAEDLKAVALRDIGPPGEVSEDGLFSWTEVECLGACVNAPMCLINADSYEDLTEDSFAAILEDFRSGRPVTPGSQTGRQNAAPESGAKTLVFNPSMPHKTRKPKGEDEGADVKPSGDLLLIIGLGKVAKDKLIGEGISSAADFVNLDPAMRDALLSKLGLQEKAVSSRWLAQAEAVLAGASPDDLKSLVKG